MALVYPGAGSGSSQTQNNNFGNVPFLTQKLMCRTNKFNLNSSDPAAQYQTQKIIQNTVRVQSSLYTMNLGALNVYQKPLPPYYVNWNQMSDRAVPHYQTNSAKSQGSSYHGSSVRHTQTRPRPGAGTPGGYGVDMKHNSYHRYLSRLVAKRDIRRGPIPPNYGAPIKFNCAFPVYGGKTVKTAIVNGCECSANNAALVYRTDFAPVSLNPYDNYVVGQKVYARISDKTPMLQAVILGIDPAGYYYTIQFNDDQSIAKVHGNQIIPWFPCDCSSSNNSSSNNGTNNVVYNGQIIDVCSAVDSLITPNYLDFIIQELTPSFS